MIKPRNTLVVLELIEQPSRQVGAITVPTNGEQYTEAEVIAVGPGNVSAEGGRSETFDLYPGQRVLVKHKHFSRGPMGQMLENSGVRYDHGGKVYYLYEQTSIFGIIAEPEKSAYPPLVPLRHEFKGF